MKLLISILLVVSSSAFAADKTISCQGTSLLGSRLELSEGGWFSTGKIVFKDSLPFEFEWTGKEAEESQSDLKNTLLSMTGITDSKNFIGAENVGLIVEPLKVFSSSINLGTVSTSSKLYVEEGLLNGTKSDGIVALISISQVGVQAEASVLISKCK